MPTIVWALPQVNPHVDFETLRHLNAASAGKIESLDDARAYMKKSATLCGLTDFALMPDDFELRLATAEFHAARDPKALVSDDQVAAAFNFMSDEFRVAHPVLLTASDILQYRSVMASIFPNIFSPKGVTGSRPVGAMVTLWMLVYNGGITDGVRKAAQLDRPPGSLKVSASGGRIVPNRNPTPIATEYQRASLTYFHSRSRQDVRSFLGRIAGIMAL